MIKNKQFLSRVLPSKKDVGRFGELAACHFLRRKGHKIVAQNVNVKVGEIDILSERDCVIHFIEVKSVFGDENRELKVFAEEHLDRKKLIKLNKTATAYLSTHPDLHEREFSIDAILVNIYKKEENREVSEAKTKLFPKNISRVALKYLENVGIY